MKTQTQYDVQAAEFLDSVDLSIEIVKTIAQTCPEWDGEGRPQGGCPVCCRIHGLKYRITLRKGLDLLAFDFWGSAADMDAHEDPSAYDVLACISSDSFCPDTFADFCGEYGYNEDSRRALSMFKRCAEFAKRICAFFDESELERLREIQ